MLSIKIAITAISAVIIGLVILGIYACLLVGGKNDEE
jgi:hypothetical protein